MDEQTKEICRKQRKMMQTHFHPGISDEKEGVEQPLLEQPAPDGWRLELPTPSARLMQGKGMFQVLASRVSHRKFDERPLSLEALSMLLWATQGVKKVVGKAKKATFRTVPSAGARHPFETYLFVNRVEGLQPGLYRYLALSHELVLLRPRTESMFQALEEAFAGQRFFAQAPVAFVWSVVPGRGEWRYGVNAHKYMLIDAGHVCQNLYLAAEAMGLGVCAIGAYQQEAADALMGFAASEEEFVVYGAAVGGQPEEE